MSDGKKTALVLGAGGFIGSHMVTRLKNEGYWVRGVDIKPPEFSPSDADHFIIQDLTAQSAIQKSITHPETPEALVNEIYQFAADMGGAGYVFTGENDANVMSNSALINLHLLREVQLWIAKTKKDSPLIFYSSSACIYPEHNQMDPDTPNCSEDSAYPANPDSEYGWEKLFSERLYLSFHRNYGLNCRIARYHNIFGPKGTWQGGKEKAPAAICRKVALAADGDNIDCWGDGKQTRSFLFIDECIEATRRLMQSDFIGPVNIGSEEMVSINDLILLTAKIANKKVGIQHIDGPLGVRGRNSDNRLIREKLGWNYQLPLADGMKKTYAWIQEQIKHS